MFIVNSFRNKYKENIQREGMGSVAKRKVGLLCFFLSCSREKVRFLGFIFSDQTFRLFWRYQKKQMSKKLRRKQLKTRVCWIFISSSIAAGTSAVFRVSIAIGGTTAATLKCNVQICSPLPSVLLNGGIPWRNGMVDFLATTMANLWIPAMVTLQATMACFYWGLWPNFIFCYPSSAERSEGSRKKKKMNRKLWPLFFL